MRFSNEFKRRVLEANNIVDIISHHTQLKPSGSGLMGRCPFPDHKEKTPSFSVSETKQLYHCFGCHKSGDLITFLIDFNGYTYPEALVWLAQRASIPLPEREEKDSEFDRQEARRKQLLKINQMAASFFVEQLKRTSPTDPVRLYIEKRGLTPETVELFRIGFAPKEWDSLLTWLQGKNAPVALAEEAKLVVPRKEGRVGHFDMFRDRLMFPIQNTMGDVLAFGGRVLNPEDNPKYLNSPETPVFEKKKVLYGLHQTARYIRSEDQALIVEGYMDAVSLFQAGFRNVAAVMSSSLTPEQARLIKRMTRNVVVLLDGDAAGMDGAERSLPTLLQADLYPKGLFLPEGQDPDDFVKSSGPEALRDLLERAQDLLFVVMDRWMEGYRGEPAEKLKLVDKLKPILAGVADPRLRDLYLQEVARRLSVGAGWLQQALQFQSSPKTSAVASQSPGLKVNPRGAPSVSSSGGVAQDLISLKGASPAELLVMGLSLKSRANFEIFLSENLLETFSHEGVRRILSEAIEVYGQEPERFDRLTSLLVTSVDQPELLFPKEPAGLKGTEEFDGEIETRHLRDGIRRVKVEHLRGELQRVLMELQKDPNGAELRERLVRFQNEIGQLNRTKTGEPG